MTRFESTFAVLRSHAVHHSDTRAVHTCAMAQRDDFDRQAWLDALSALVQLGSLRSSRSRRMANYRTALRRRFTTCESSQGVADEPGSRKLSALRNRVGERDHRLSCAKRADVLSLRGVFGTWTPFGIWNYGYKPEFFAEVFLSGFERRGNDNER